MKKAKVAMAVGLWFSIACTSTIFAETVEYNYHLNHGENQVSFTATKAGGSGYENVYYVRQEFTATDQGSSPKIRYASYDGNRKVSSTLLLRYGDRIKHFNDYTITAVAGKDYNLFCQYDAASSGSSLQVVGRWTP